MLFGNLSLILFAGILFGWNGVAFAERSASFKGQGEYIVPVTKNELKPLSKFAIHDLQVEKNADGQFVMKFKMPYDLVGGKVLDISLLEQEGTSPDTISFINEAGLGFAECKGEDWPVTKCKYDFQGLKGVLDVALTESYLSQKYKADPNLEKRKEVSVGIFSTEPIGEANLIRSWNGCDNCRLGNGEWTGSYTIGDEQTVNCRVSLEGKSGVYFNDTGSGVLKNLVYSANAVTGTWIYENGSEGWFRFQFSNGAENFSGNWGTGAPGAPAQGTWEGEKD